MTEQTPVETPPIMNTTTPPPQPPLPSPPSPAPQGGDFAGQIISFFTSPLNILLVVGIALGVVGLLVVIVKAVQALHAHPLSRKLGSWLSSPGVDVIVIGVDPYTRECKLIPCKRVGSMYIGVEEGVFITPIGGGESYVLHGTGKPVIFALRHGHGVQYNPASEQIISISLTPLTDKEDTQSLKDLRRTLLSIIQTESAKITGEIYISPDVKLYVSAKAPRVLEALRKEIALANSIALVATQANIKTITEEGARIIEAHARLTAAKRTTLIIGVAVLLLIIAIVLYVIKMAGIL